MQKYEEVWRRGRKSKIQRPDTATTEEDVRIPGGHYKFVKLGAEEERMVEGVEERRVDRHTQAGREKGEVKGEVGVEGWSRVEMAAGGGGEGRRWNLVRFEKGKERENGLI